MAIKLSIDLSDATFAEMAAVIGYAHQLGVDPDEKLTFEGTVLTIEFDGDLQPDDLFMTFDDGMEDLTDLDSPDDREGPLYVDDVLDVDDLGAADDRGHYRPRGSRGEDSAAEDVLNDIGEAVNKFVQGFMNGRDNGGYGDFGGGFGGPAGPFGPLGPFGPFGPRGPRGPRNRY